MSYDPPFQLYLEHLEYFTFRRNRLFLSLRDGIAIAFTKRYSLENLASEKGSAMSLLLTQTPVIWPAVALAFWGGYLSGSVPYGLLLGKMSGLGDIRKAGGGKIGATHVLRG